MNPAGSRSRRRKLTTPDRNLIKGQSTGTLGLLNRMVGWERANAPESVRVKYCVKVTCPVPTTWDAPPAISLWSSHLRWKQGWNSQFYFDLYAEGRATAGGYCNADGTLADIYQG